MWHEERAECQQRAATCDAYRATNRLRIAARRALEWSGMFEGLTRFYQPAACKVRGWLVLR